MEIRPTIKNHSHGYVKPDGNPMTGGEWWNTTALYKKFIPIDSLTENDAVAEWLADRYGDEAVYIEAYITESEDTSTDTYICEVEDWFDDNGFVEVVNICPLLTDEGKVDLLDMLDLQASIIENYKPCE